MYEVEKKTVNKSVRSKKSSSTKEKEEEERKQKLQLHKLWQLCWPRFEHGKTKKPNGEREQKNVQVKK